MDILQQHEIFEIDVLDKMNSAKVLEPLVFGGGTMLRLCHDLNRYSADLDFWFIKNVSQSKFFKDTQRVFEKNYEVTDAQIKRNTLLFELRSALYPKRLKIEIRRTGSRWDFQKTIAFSRHSTRQVLLNCHTLNQSMKNKIAAFLDRGEIRDVFDIEFLLRRGVELPDLTESQYNSFLEILSRFKTNDFKVKLCSILPADIRDYYVDQRFAYLKEKLHSLFSSKTFQLLILLLLLSTQHSVLSTIF